MSWLTFWLVDSVDELQRPDYRKDEGWKWFVLGCLILIAFGILMVKGLLS